MWMEPSMKPKGGGGGTPQWTMMSTAAMEMRWAFPLAVSSLLCLLLLATPFNMGLVNPISSLFPFKSPLNQTTTADQSKLSAGAGAAAAHPSPPEESSPAPAPARLAYLVSGSKGDLERLWRTLRALYHPRNQYVVHLDRESPVAERAELARRVERDPLFAAVGNVHVIAKANMVTYRGPTMVSNTLHACAILLRKSRDWDWFINLSASDYPLVTQDDLLYTFSQLPRNVNFVEHTSRLGWKEPQRAKPLIIDPGLYKSQKSDIFWAGQRRELPTTFKLFTGSAWMGLTRDFVEYCVWGWDNLPRTLLMYYTNFVSSPEGYFQTVICNSAEFAATAVNHDLHYISWDVPPKQHPQTLTDSDTPNMVASNAPFARKFARDDPVLDRIDAQLLRGRTNGSFVLGGWCAGEPPCSAVGNAGRFEPGPGAVRLDKLMGRIVRSEAFTKNQCT